jgi:hypothetical protein
MTMTQPATSETVSTTPPQAAPSFAEIRSALRNLPEIHTNLSPAAFLAAADAASKAGKLPGFEKTKGYFSTLLFGAPFDRVMDTTATDQGGKTIVRFRSRLLWKIPSIFVILIVFSIWPGVTLTDSLLRTYFTGYTIQTWWWYLPLTVLPLPWYIPKTVKKSEASCLLAAMENIQLLAERTRSEVVEPR